MIARALNLSRFWKATSYTTKRLITYRRLLGEQLRRELFEQHAGHMMGSVWLIAHPVFLMLIYVFVFSFVFKAKVGGTHDMPLDYTTYILSGLIPWLTIQQALSKSCSALTQNKSLIKQVVFPLEVLAARAVIACIVPFVVMIAVLLLYHLVFTGSIPLSYVFLPVVVFGMVLWLLGIGFALSATTVFIRDVRELVTMFLTAGMFLLPVVYLPDWIPSIFQPVIYANPFSYLIWCFQDVLYFGRMEHPEAWVVMFVGGIFVYAMGARSFQAVKPYFGDAI